MQAIPISILLLVLSNVFMTFAWYAHLKNLSGSPWYIAALVSWGIALFEYLLQVPANRIGYTVMTLPQLKILQEAITLAVFVPFVVFYMRQPLKLDYLWAALLHDGRGVLHLPQVSTAIHRTGRGVPRRHGPHVHRPARVRLGGDGRSAGARGLLPAAARPGGAAPQRDGPRTRRPLSSPTWRDSARRCRN